MGRRKNRARPQMDLNVIEMPPVIKNIDMKIVLTDEVHSRVMHWVRESSVEVSGFGVVQMIGGVPTVTKVYILDEGHSVETTISPDKINDLQYERHVNKEPGELRWWWHSHVNMGVFWSTTDKTAMAGLSELGWFSYTVFNKSGDMRSAISFHEPVRLLVDEVKTVVDKVIPKELTDQWTAELQKIRDSKPKVVAPVNEYWDRHRGTTKRFDINTYRWVTDLPSQASEAHWPTLYNNVPAYEIAAEITEELRAGLTKEELIIIMGKHNYDRGAAYVDHMDTTRGYS